MRVFVAVNEIRDIGPRQTTALLVAALIRAGHNVVLFDISGISAASAQASHQIVVRGVLVDPSLAAPQEIAGFAGGGLPLSVFSVQDPDLILIRTNPGRDKLRSELHSGFLDLCKVAKAVGITVINDPGSLEFFASKASLAGVEPAYCPPLLVSNDPDELAEFVRSAPVDCVLKPTRGSRGADVIRINRDSSDLDSIIHKITQSRRIVVQHFVTAAVPGDKRVVVIDGDVLCVNGHYGGIERHPCEHEFRANLHAGGTAHPLTLTDAEMKTARYAARLLNDHGIRLAGVDLIDARIIEFNVFSTGGLFDAERFSNCDFSAEIVCKLIETKP